MVEAVAEAVLVAMVCALRTVGTNVEVMLCGHRLHAKETVRVPAILHVKTFVIILQSINPEMNIDCDVFIHHNLYLTGYLKSQLWKN
jgi:hypothetical protein